jgi:hypothetical protein
MSIARALCLSACLAMATPAAAATATAGFDDGPYVSYGQDELTARWICDGEAVKETYPATRWPVTVPARCGYPRPVQVRAPVGADDSLPVQGVRTVVAVSDIHGQFDLLVRLLQANGVIDADWNWALGDAHLMVSGDVFDRGARVTEAFWLLYTLQGQARAAGGGVHMMLGNHETMVLYDDLRYLNDRYWESAKALGTSYPALYGADTVIGNWLRGAPGLGFINDMVFLHGGISPQFQALGLAPEEVNARYRASLGLPRHVVRSDPRYVPLYDGKTSPIWYRGYFRPGELTQADVDAIAGRLGVRHMVVGHTSMNQVGGYFDGRVIAIDSSIKAGENGELLFVEDGVMSRGLLDGSRAPLQRPASPDTSD